MGKGTKIGAIIGSIMALLSSLAVIVFLILGLCGVFGLDDDKANTYHVVFVADEKVLYDEYLVKGTKLDVKIYVPRKPNDDEYKNYKFIGWDTNGDYIVNPLPSRVYYSFTAVAIYAGTRIAPIGEAVR